MRSKAVLRYLEELLRSFWGDDYTESVKIERY